MATTSPIDLPTSPSAAHRVDAPLWGFHTAVAYVAWVAAVVRWFWVEYEMPISGKHVIPVVAGVVVLFIAVFALGMGR